MEKRKQIKLRKPGVYKPPGKPVKNVEQLVRMAEQRKSVYVLQLRRRQPASWLVNSSGLYLVGLIKRGQLCE